MDPEQYRHMMAKALQRSNNFWQKKFIDLKLRERGFDPAVPGPQERREVGDGEMAEIRRIIKDCEELIHHLKIVQAPYIY